MDSKPVRRKSINLFLLIFIILFIISLTILLIYLINNSSSDKDDSENTEGTSAHIQLANNTEKTNNSVNTLPESSNTINNVSTNTVSTENHSNQKKLILNEHTLEFDENTDAFIVQTSDVSELQINYPDSNCQIVFNTDKSVTFEELKANASLTSYLESKYNLSVTSPIKTGVLNDLDIIMCTVSYNDKQAYFIITPLNDSEILYSKIYNINDTKTLLEDLSKPLDEISSIKSKIQN